MSDEYAAEVVQRGDVWHVYTSRNGSNGWGIGIDFTTHDHAEAVARAIRNEVALQTYEAGGSCFGSSSTTSASTTS